MQKLNIAVVGATGLIGRTMLKILDEYSIPIGKLELFASTRSAGKTVEFQGKSYTVRELCPDEIAKAGALDFALFSAGGKASRVFAPLFAARGCTVIDNSSAWRMNPESPLVVPEVNPQALRKPNNYIIANPNCSTIQMTLPLKALSDAFGLHRVVVSTYQSIAGAGQKGIDKLMHEIAGQTDSALSPLPIAFNTIFHSFPVGADFTEEETKMINETRKILELPKLAITATCVRLPILGGHGESLNVELEHDFSISEVVDVLGKFPNIVVMNGTTDGEYPTVKTCEGSDKVFVGRIRRDSSVERGVHLWICGDNVRKGAASNAVQILRLLTE